MKYFLIKSFSSAVNPHNLVLEINDPNHNSWLVNYGMDLDYHQKYFNIKFYGNEHVLKEQSILNIENIFIFNRELRSYLENIINIEDIEWLDFELYNSDDKKISHDFKIINFKTTVDCLNWHSSKFDLFDKDEKRYVFYTIKVTQEINQYLFGCIDGLKGIFINEEMKRKIEKKEFKNLAFKELSIETV